MALTRIRNSLIAANTITSNNIADGSISSLDLQSNALINYTGDINVSSLSVTSIVANGSTGSANQVLTSNGTTVYWDDVTGGAGGGSLTFSNTAPGSPNAGDVWVNSDTSIKYTYVNDGDTSQWVELGSRVAISTMSAGIIRISNINVTNSSYGSTNSTSIPAADGGYVQVEGSGFQNGCHVVIESTNATSTQFQSSSVLNVQVPAKSANSYVVYVVNPDGGVGLRPNGITYSA